MLISKAWSIYSQSYVNPFTHSNYRVDSCSNQPLILFKQIVEVVLRQGLVHPITCVPSLIALETDPQEVNSKLAHHLLMNMNEKYTLFVVRIIELPLDIDEFMLTLLVFFFQVSILL